MAQSSGGEIVTLLLVGGAAWIGWNIYQSYLAAQYAAAAAASAPPQQPSTPAATPTTPEVVIPANFTVTPTGINNAFSGTVTYNGSPTNFSLIFSGGQATGQVYNSAGSDVTAQLGAANVTTLVNAFNAAVQAELIQGTISSSTPGMSGLGQVRRAARIAVPRLVVRRMGVEG